MVPLEPGEVVSARIILAKPDSRWAVASSKDGRLFVVQVRVHSNPEHVLSSFAFNARRLRARQANVKCFAFVSNAHLW